MGVGPPPPIPVLKKSLVQKLADSYLRDDRVHVVIGTPDVLAANKSITQVPSLVCLISVCCAGKEGEECQPAIAI